MNDKQRAEEIEKRTAAGIQATAVIVLSSSVPRKRGHVLIVHLVLNIKPPDRDVYRGRTDWNVSDEIAASQYQKGQSIAVRIDADNPEIVYPGVPWATFYDPTRDNDLAFKRRLF